MKINKKSILYQPFSFFDYVKFIPDERVPDNEMWACSENRIDKILNLDTNEIKTPELPILIDKSDEKKD